MVKCMIVDDEPLAQQVLENHIQQIAALELTASCFNATEAFTVLHQQPVDLLFLDIKMPVMTGIQFIQSLKKPPAFIFTTAYADFALLSYDLQAVDYLLKPITYERFQKSIDRFLQQLPAKPLAPGKNYLYIKVDANLVKVYHHDIRFAQSMKDYIKITTATGSYITHLTMKSLQDVLPGNLFMRVHRSYIVNTEHISVIGRDSVTIGDITIPIGENYKTNLKNITE